ncbi:hypothetical protein [Enterococcus faecalis]|nr:hypothetical protein [Enterococcus faecalis]MDB7744813.1 hypothetical protein [Enterococcus faecalis]
MTSTTGKDITIYEGKPKAIAKDNFVSETDENRRIFTKTFRGI